MHIPSDGVDRDRGGEPGHEVQAGRERQNVSPGMSLLCPNPPQFTVTLKAGWLVGQLVGLSIGQENLLSGAFVILKVAVFVSLLQPTSGQQGVFVRTALFKIFPCQDLATIFFGIQDL